MEYTIYALELQDGKWYIGKTRSNLDKRFNEHKNGFGSHWTAINKPINISKIMYGDDIDEHHITIRYMKDKGIENVRGASYTSVTLTDYQRKDLEDIILGAQDKCYNCGESGHFVSECDKPRKRYECFKCGEIGHFGRDCAKIHAERAERKRKQSEEDVRQDIALKKSKQV